LLMLMALVKVVSAQQPLDRPEDEKWEI